MNKFKIVIGLVLVAIFSPTHVYADDTEIFFARANAADSENYVKANVLFLLDTSGSMEGKVDGSDKTKMQELKEAFAKVIDGLGSDIDVGLAKFNGGYDTSGYGGYVFYPVSEMTDTARTEIKGLVNGLSGTSNTPTMEAYSETARYMLGQSPTGYAYRGESAENKPRQAVNVAGGCERKGNRRYGYWWECDSAARYDSPVNLNNQCESNHIIVMTDGQPTQDYDDESVEDITGGKCSASYGCQEHLAEWLLNDGKDVEGVRKSIKTWQVAFGVGDAKTEQGQDMDKVAKKGLPKDNWYVSDDNGTPNNPDDDEFQAVRFANSAEELAKEFKEILDLVDDESRTLSSPGVSVNQMNRFQHLNQLYYAVFAPNKDSYWEGNLKKYELENRQIVGETGNAIDPDTGYFSETSRSFWSDEVDGFNVKKGGARAEIEKATRTLYFNDGASVEKLEWGLIGETGGKDKTFFGLPSTATDEELEDLVEHLKVQWGDPLHSVPVLVNYGGDAQNNLLFVSNNGGMLHAVDTQDGSENYAFMPEEFIGKANEFMVGGVPLTEDNRRQTYALDSSWIAWRKPNKTDPLKGKPEAVYLYGGMRRGGRTYYALDVSSKSSPKVLWKIAGGVTAGFEDLGQTWSVPTLTQIMDGDEKVPVLVFGGGYSPGDHDLMQGQGRSSGDRLGNAIYIVNAETGKLLWSTSGGNMKWSVPGSISVVDKDFDGLADFLYFGDLGGQLFRIDIDQSGGKSMTVNRLADLGGATASNNRRFYDAPAVAYIVENGKKKLFVIAGSGYRSHPLDETINDGLFVIKDATAMLAPAEKPDELSMADLVKVTTDKVAADSKGWYLPAGNKGEKFLASPVAYPSVNEDGEPISILLATSYMPTTQDQDDNPCAVRYGAAALYTMDLITGNGVDFNNDGVADQPRRKDLEQTTIPPKPVPVTGEDGTDYLIGPELVPGGPSRYEHLRKRRWYQMDKSQADVFKTVEE